MGDTTPGPIEQHRLLDRRALRRELGVSERVADAIFSELPTVRVPGVRREFIRREHLEGALERWTRIS
jgi:hypothetical protein